MHASVDYVTKISANNEILMQVLVEHPGDDEKQHEFHWPYLYSSAEIIIKYPM